MTGLLPVPCIEEEGKVDNCIDTVFAQHVTQRLGHIVSLKDYFGRVLVIRLAHVDSQDLFDRVVLLEPADQPTPDVAGRAGNGDAGR